MSIQESLLGALHVAKVPWALVAGTAIAAPQLPEHFILVLIAGFAGGLIRMFAEKEKIWPTGFGTVITGAATAVFVWPVGQPWIEGLLGTKLNLEPSTAAMFGGFITGVMGVSFVGLILDFTRARRRTLQRDEGDD